MPRRMLVLLTVLMLTAAACGARLSDDQRAAGISVDAAGAVTGDGTATGDALTDGGTVEDGAVPGAVTGGGDGGGGGAGGGAVTGGGGATGDGDPGETATEGGETCTPGGSSDTGVSPNQVTVAVGVDLTGPAPGLFKGAQQAVQAHANRINSEGGVCGRAIKVVTFDTKTDAGANRAAVLDACDQAFAMVGSMSAFDSGGASAVEECGIPDISAIIVNSERLDTSWSYPAFPSRQDILAIGQSTYIKQQFPEVIDKAAILWLNTAVTRNNADARRKAWEEIGFEFIYQREVQVLEPNYTPFVLDMQNAGVEYVTMVGDNNSIVRLLKSARQQGWAPTVWDWDSVAYDPRFVQNADGAADGSYVFINSAMVEEAQHTPEMASYVEWVDRSFPGARPDYFGTYGWSAMGLFAEKLRELGPDPTREALRDALAGTESWDGNGVHGAHRTGEKLPGTCFLYMQIQGGEFVREHPSEPGTWDCDLAGTVQV